MNPGQQNLPKRHLAPPAPARMRRFRHDSERVLCRLQWCRQDNNRNWTAQKRVLQTAFAAILRHNPVAYPMNQCAWPLAGLADGDLLTLREAALRRTTPTKTSRARPLTCGGGAERRRPAFLYKPSRGAAKQYRNNAKTARPLVRAFGADH